MLYLFWKSKQPFIVSNALHIDKFSVEDGTHKLVVDFEVINLFALCESGPQEKAISELQRLNQKVEIS